jgi:hypothetical protein
MKILFLILIGAVSIAAFIGILYVLGYLTIKLNIIEKDNDKKSEVTIGSVMLFLLFVMSCLCYIIGEGVLILIQ